jgi:hypothetical protein
MIRYKKTARAAMGDWAGAEVLRHVSWAYSRDATSKRQRANCSRVRIIFGSRSKGIARWTAAELRRLGYDPVARCSELS